MPPSLDRLRRLEALAADAAASPAERATAERLADRERAALGPAASSSTLPGWSAEELAEYRRRQGEALARWREDQEWRRRRDAEVAEALRRGAALIRGQVPGRPAVASERRPQWRPVGQWGPGRRW